MKIIYAGLAVLLASCSPGAKEESTVSSEQTQSSEIYQEAEPFVVLELFSSEGCSDCPAAEEVLNKITRDAMANKTYVYPLAFHVDYWNKLGWKDVFSDSAYSNRQRKYRPALGNEVVYTPQSIVNGEVEFVGSDEKRSKAVIDSFLTVKPEWYFTIHPDESQLEKGIIKTEYEIIKRPEEKESRLYNICFALVERKLETNVTRGENKGKKLQHENIVRFFTSQKLESGKGEYTINYAPGKIGKNHSLIVFVQDAASMKIGGANLWNF